MVSPSSASGSASSESPSQTDESGDPTRMSFGDHLEELRACLIRALVGLGIATLISLVFAKGILGFIITPALVVLHAHGERPELLALSPAGPFLLYLKVGFLSGAIISTPWIVLQIWSFVSTGLYERERRFARPFMWISFLLFACGVSFMFYIVLPIVMNFFVTFSQGFELPDLELSWFQQVLLGQEEREPIAGTVPTDFHVPVVDVDPTNPDNGTIWVNSKDRSLYVQTPDGLLTANLKPATAARSISSQFGIQFFLSFVFSLALGFGLAFELPVVVVFVAITGIVSCASMAKSRKYVLFGIVVAAAVLTPPDVISQLLLAVPMYALFEAGLLVARSFEKKRDVAT